MRFGLDRGRKTAVRPQKEISSMFALLVLGMLAALFAVVFNLSTVLSVAGQAIRKIVQWLARRSVLERQQGRGHKKITVVK